MLRKSASIRNVNIEWKKFIQATVEKQQLKGAIFFREYTREKARTVKGAREERIYFFFLCGKMLSCILNKSKRQVAATFFIFSSF